MFFDDRLATVLRQRASSEAGLRTQFRQLLDILGNRRRHAAERRDSSLLAAAWLRMDALAEAIPAPERAEIIREQGWRLRTPELAAHLAEFEPEVASAALTRADLTAEDWAKLIPNLPVRARGFLRLRRDLPIDVEKLLERLGIYDRGLPVPDGSLPGEAEEQGADIGKPSEQPGPAVKSGEKQAGASAARPPRPGRSPRGADETEAGRSEISALVERIAQFRRDRDAPSREAERSPSLPLDLPLENSEKYRRANGFGFACDATGRIEWADPEVASMVIGTRLVSRQTLGHAREESPLERAFNRRQPIVRASRTLAGAEAIAGRWLVDARPRFGEDGGFSGYVGRFRRRAESDEGAPGPAEREADRIRQLLHELRTPVTAVQGYAEVIQQQLFGHAPNEYRALAAAIAADAARILAGFDELDRLARLESGTAEVASGECDLAAIATRIAGQLAQVLGPKLCGIAFDPPADRALFVAIDPDEAEALVWRLMATIGSGCAAGEMLKAALVPVLDGASGDETTLGLAQLSIELPSQLLAEEDVFAAETRPTGAGITAGLFGAGFALRLARAEARAAGGKLERAGQTMVLSLPLLATALGHSPPVASDASERDGARGNAA